MVKKKKPDLSPIKPLGRKAYGHIPHLPGSRLGTGDHKISEGQARIATQKSRDSSDLVIVQEKLDGSNVAIAKLADGRIVALGRSGYLAESSPYLQHHLFSDWVHAHRDRFDKALQIGEWISGEWLAQAHGTLYRLVHEPFIAFDWWVDGCRLPVNLFCGRCDEYDIVIPRILHYEHSPFSVEQAIAALEDRDYHGALDPIEGAVWRVERETADGRKVDFLCKYVRPGKQDGCYLPTVPGQSEVWNEGLIQFLPTKAKRRLQDGTLG